MAKDNRMWGGRFSRKPTEKVEKFSTSLSVDYRLALYDIAGSIAHAKMLAKVGIIKEAEAEKIIAGLSEIKAEIEGSRFSTEPSDEDVHTAIERRLYEKIGEQAGKLHTGRSRNDQIALDERLYVKDLTGHLDRRLKSLQQAFLLWLQKYPKVIMPAFTHLQHSQVILFSHWVLAYVEMFQRDRERLRDALNRVDVSPLGAGAGGGSSLPLDPEYSAKLLGFGKVFTNSLDAVSDRDFLVEVLADLSLIAVHLSRLCEELVLWSTIEFNYIEIDQRYCTGSSALPQKKNPDIPELVRGKAGLVFGSLMSLLTTLKGLPLSYNRDLQEDKAGFFSAADTVLDSLTIISEMIPKIKVNTGAMEKAAEKGYTTAIDLAEYLVKKGVSFREAHRIVGAVIKYCDEKNKGFSTGKGLSVLSLPEMKKFSRLFSRDVRKVLSTKDSIGNRCTLGSTNPKLVTARIQNWTEVLK
ncbi:MAG: argininosuccinate lyase [Candidatus Omnitrophota bacterium]